MWFIGAEVEQETSAPPPKKKILDPPLLFKAFSAKKGNLLTGSQFSDDRHGSYIRIKIEMQFVCEYIPLSWQWLHFTSRASTVLIVSISWPNISQLQAALCTKYIIIIIIIIVVVIAIIMVTVMVSSSSPSLLSTSSPLPPPPPPSSS